MEMTLLQVLVALRLFWAVQSADNCTVGQWKCDDGACIGYSNVCDGTNQCTTGSDEANCCSTSTTPSSAQFRCNNGVCKQVSTKVCSGNDDCGDRSDESHCGTTGGYTCFSCTDCESSYSDTLTCANGCGKIVGADKKVHRTCAEPFGAEGCITIKIFGYDTILCGCRSDKCNDSTRIKQEMNLVFAALTAASMCILHIL